MDADMQRPASSSRASDDNRHDHVIDIMQQHQQPQAKHSPKRKTEGLADHSFSEHSGVGRREMPRSRSRANWIIHVIPVIVLLCFFILWWFSYPVNLEIKDGRIMEVHRIEMMAPVKNTLVDHTILASATPSNASVPQFLTLMNETEAQPVSPTD